MKTTLVLPDELLREAKARAAREGRSLEDLFSSALRNHLQAGERVVAGDESWRAVFGQADPAAVAEVDAMLASELEAIDLET